MTWLGSPPFNLKVPYLFNYSHIQFARSLQCRFLTLFIAPEFRPVFCTFCYQLKSILNVDLIPHLIKRRKQWWIEYRNGWKKKFGKFQCFINISRFLFAKIFLRLPKNSPGLISLSTKDCKEYMSESFRKNRDIWTKTAKTVMKTLMNRERKILTIWIFKIEIELRYRANRESIWK